MTINPGAFFFAVFSLGICWLCRTQAAFLSSSETLDVFSDLGTDSAFEDRRGEEEARRRHGPPAPWPTGLFKPFSTAERTFAPRVRQGAEGDIKHLELLVVVGSDVYHFHKEDTKRYILTNLNIGAELLRDASLGAQFRVHLIRMIVLTQPEEGITISANITSSIISLCEWTTKVNPENDSDPYHADLVLYVTRFDLQLPDGNKQARGITQLGGACSTSWSCVITEDTGFGLGVTIAHEIGHSFGIQHDGEGNRCSGSGHIMGSEGGQNSVDLTWSACSREQLSAFVSTGQASCTDDLPDLKGGIPGEKPGLYYGADEQCKIAFGADATACTFAAHDMDMCKVLSCHTNPADQPSCTRLLVPLLDGTECGINKWCSKGRCSSLEDLHPVAMVHGHWSSWTAFTACSRSCGGGIMARRRQCNNPRQRAREQVGRGIACFSFSPGGESPHRVKALYDGALLHSAPWPGQLGLPNALTLGEEAGRERPAFGGHQCEGEDLQAEMCNVQPCQTTQLDFMDEQCAATDSKPLYLRPETPSFYKWISAAGYAKGDTMCKHMCRASGKNFMVSRGDRFADGTKCERNSPADQGALGVCVMGGCKVFGCDGRMDSGKRMDVCQVCDGENRTCFGVKGSFTEGRAREYVTFLVLSPNTTTVHVVNRNPLFTHLAVKVQGRYVVAGMGSISLNISYPSVVEDCRIEYKLYLTEENLPSSEEVCVDGPVQEEIEIQVYRKYGKAYGGTTSPDIAFTYFRPNEKRAHVWVPQLGPCSVTCGQGALQVSHSCFDPSSGEITGDFHCLKTPKPPARQEPCAASPCLPRWLAEEFGPCSVTCGGGVAERLVRCAKEEGGLVVSLPDPACAAAPRPPSVEPCNAEMCPARWVEAEPGRCSAVCGLGVAPLNSSCVQVRDGLETTVEESLCPVDERPPPFVSCMVNICPLGWSMEDVPHARPSAPAWPPQVGNWSGFVWSPLVGGCSVTCGRGLMLLSYVCLAFDTKAEAQEDHCNQTLKPSSLLEMCNPGPCPPRWEVKELSPCPVTCGGGKIPLLVRCVRQDGNATRTLPHSKCGRIHRPASSKECATDPCPARWFYKNGTCSASCGGGVMRKVLYCARETGEEEEEEEVLPNAHCEGLPRPEEQEACNMESCPPRWKVAATSPCSSSCGLGVATQSVSCVQLSGGQEVELAKSGCPEAEKPPSSVPCIIRMCPYEWGFTQWTECSVTCGTGIQRRKDFCLSPQTGARVNPILCMHSPKPMMVRACSVAACPEQTADDVILRPNLRSWPPDRLTTTAVTVGPGEPRYRAVDLPPLGGPSPSMRQSEAIPGMDDAEENSVCGRLFLNATGTIDMTGVGVSDCTAAIGRPLGEVISFQVVETNLNCSAGEMVLFSTRIMWRMGCKKLTLSAMQTRTNTLMVRQRLLQPGNGIVLRYSSRTASRKHHQDCDVQLFGPHGEIVSPVPSAIRGLQVACRTFIDVAPRHHIAIHAVFVALSSGPANQTHSSYISIRDVDAMKTAVFRGNQLFYWESTGSRAEIEFSKHFARGSFRAQYWVTVPK